MGMNLKDAMKNLDFRAEARKVFFEGMNAGYASNVKKGTISELPGSKLIPPYVRGPWKLTDMHHVSPVSVVSGGMTVIAYEDTPVWMMQYFGAYDDKAIPCLKAALRECYAKNKFRGGRGPQRFTHKEYVYENPEIFLLDFDLFRGEEQIYDKHGNVLGRHLYHGGLMR